MPKRKGVLQKAAFVSAVISFILAVVSGITLAIRLQTVGSDNPISASLMAATFFFVCVGVVLYVMGTADLPSFKLDNNKK